MQEIEQLQQPVDCRAPLESGLLGLAGRALRAAEFFEFAGQAERFASPRRIPVVVAGEVQQATAR
ncbi:MAG: hypothetical protein KDC98_15235, partial [Planctomycetes bacterium]|nr:hypothetical protein [Planctomycetota bacterium]